MIDDMIEEKYVVAADATDRVNLVLLMICNRIVCPDGWTMRTDYGIGYGGSYIIDVGVSDDSIYKPKFMPHGDTNNQYVLVPNFELQSTPAIYTFQFYIPMGWDRINVRRYSGSDRKMVCIVGCEGDRLLFASNGVCEEFFLGDPEFDVGVISGRINLLVI